jgi:type II secretory pathway component GspD/PulD (secretin)
VPHDHTKTLFVGAESEWTLERVRNWVEELDLPDEGDAPSKTLILPLKETRARVVAEHIARLLTPPKAVRIVPDPYDKRLWVKGPERTIEVVKEIVDCLEEGAAASQSQMTDERRLHFCDVKQADPVSLATSLEQVATMMGLGARLVVDVPSRTLVLYATPEDATKLQEVINRLDVMPKAASQPPLPPVHREEPPP